MSTPAKLGAEPTAERKKVAILILLVVVAGVIYFHQPSSSEQPSEASKAPLPTKSSLKPLFQSSAAVEGPASPSGGAASPASGKAALREFKPSMKRKPGSTLDPENFDPSLRTDLLVKVATVRVEHVERSLFDFYTPPEISQRVIMIGPEPPPPPPAPVVAPPPPPIPLRFFGHTIQVRGGAQKVFCVLNDQVTIPSEGEIVQRRYKVKKIMQASVLVEDLQNHHEQTLPIDKKTDTQAEAR
jgi:hypothetical protein